MLTEFVLNVYGDGPKKQILLDRAEYLIGREGGCDICLADNEVSRKHARLTVSSPANAEGKVSESVSFAAVFVEDLESLNGTFVNGHKIQKYQLQLGDRLQLGGTLIEFKRKERKEIPGRETFLQVEDSLKVFSDFQQRFPFTQREGLEIFSPDVAFSMANEAQDVDVTMSTAADAEHILKTMSHKEGENFLKEQQKNKNLHEDKWTARTQGLLHLLYEMTRSICRNTDLDRLSDELLNFLFKWVDADRGCILFFDSTTNRLIPRAKKVRKEHQNKRLIISKTILDYVLEHREGVLTTNARTDDRWDDAASVLSVGIHEALCVPLQGRYGIVGAVYLDTFSRTDEITYLQAQTGMHRLGDDDLKLMIIIAHHIALAVEDTRYYQGMLQAERLAAIGQTVTTLSHHIKNILQGIQGGNFLIQSGLEAHNENCIAKGWKIVERNQSRISALIMDMLTFSKERKPELVLNNMNLVVADVVELMLDRAARANVLMMWYPDANVPDSLFDSEAIHHAVLNIVTNAIDAVVEAMKQEKQEKFDGRETVPMDLTQTVRYSDWDETGKQSELEKQEDGYSVLDSLGDLTESVFADGSHIFDGSEDLEWDELHGESTDASDSNTNMPCGQIDILTQFDSERNVIRICVKDTGPGLTKEQVENIFKPFESSKGSRGTGLGLPVCRKIVREHGGTIHVEPRSPRGSRFVITLPVIRETSTVRRD